MIEIERGVMFDMKIKRMCKCGWCVNVWMDKRNDVQDWRRRERIKRRGEERKVRKETENKKLCVI